MLATVLIWVALIAGPLALAGVAGFVWGRNVGRREGRAAGAYAALMKSQMTTEQLRALPTAVKVVNSAEFRPAIERRWGPQ